MSVDESSPFEVQLSQEELNTRYERSGSEVRRKDQLRFELLIPIGWKKRGTTVPFAGRLATYCAGAPEECQVCVDCFETGFEVAGADLLRIRLANGGYEIEQTKASRSHENSGPMYLTRGVHPQTGAPVITYWTIAKNGSVVFLVHGSCPESSCSQYREALSIAISSFQLVCPAQWPLAEPLRSFSAGVPADYCLFYPNSWQMRIPKQSRADDLYVAITSPTGCGIQVHTIKEALFDNHEAVAAYYLDHLRTIDLKAAPMSMQPSQPIGGFSHMWKGHSELVAKDTPIKLKLTIGRRPDAWFLMSLLYPSYKSSWLTWAAGRRAYDILLETLRTPDCSTGPEYLERAIEAGRE